MPPDDANEERKASRRRFIKWAGTLAIVGAIGMEAGSVAKGLLGPSKAATATETTTTTSQASTTTTVTDTETATDLETVTDLATVTQTATATETTSVFDPQTNADAGVASRPLAAYPAPGSFTVFWITDTQFLAESNPGLYKQMNNWIVSNWGEYNGKLVIHTGDMVQTGDVQQEWQNAHEAHKVFLENKIPYTWCAGNHDDFTQDDPSNGWSGNLWAPAFDPVQIKPLVNSYGYTKWVDHYRAGMNTALAFNANGLNFLVVNLEWNAPPEVLTWLEGILDNPAYAGYNAIVAPHAYIDAYGDYDDARWGSTLSNFVNGLIPILDSHPNVFLTLNGHFASDSGYNTPTPVNGRNELMFDRQDCTDDPGDPVGRGVDDTPSTTSDGAKVGGATVTILNFDTANNKIRVSTYDVYTGQWRIDTPNQYSVDMFPSRAASPSVAASPSGKVSLLPRLH